MAMKTRGYDKIMASAAVMDLRAAAKTLEAELAALKVFEDICRSLALRPAPLRYDNVCILCDRVSLHGELAEHDFYCAWRRSREEVF